MNRTNNTSHPLPWDLLKFLDPAGVPRAMFDGLVTMKAGVHKDPAMRGVHPKSIRPYGPTCTIRLP